MNPVQLGPVASTFLVVFYLLTSLILVVLLGAVVFLVLKLNALLEKYERKIDPLLEKADTMLTTTTEKVNSIGSKAEVILNQGEELTEMVHARVDTTTTAVQKTVFTPLIGINSLLAGIKRGTQTFAQRQQNTIVDAVLKENGSPSPTRYAMETDEEAGPEIKNSVNVDQTPNLMRPTTVNTNVSNGAEPQLVSVNARRENS